jgi:2-oxoisovalerate dehydrogenase E1 component beta subunit
VIVHEAPRTCGYGAELAALVAERALMSLTAPIARVAGFDTPFPYTLEHVYLPDARRVTNAIEHVLSA